MKLQRIEQQRLSYLIVVQSMLVAVDISQAIFDFAPRAKVSSRGLQGRR
jgi:hypothetical protein